MVEISPITGRTFLAAVVMLSLNVGSASLAADNADKSEIAPKNKNKKDQPASVPAEKSRYDLAPVVVTAQRRPRSALDLSPSVHTMDSADLDAMPVKDIAEALDNLPGVTIYNEGGFKRRSTVSLRGAFARQVKVLIDNVPVNNLSQGDFNLSQVPLSAVGKVEVIKDNASPLWGSGMGGAVHILTRKIPESDTITGHTSGGFGMENTASGRTVVALRRGSLGALVSGDYVQTDGYLENTELQSRSFFSKAGWDHGIFRTRLSFGIEDADFGFFEFPDLDLTIDGTRLFRWGRMGVDAATDNLSVRTYAAFSTRRTISENRQLSTGIKLLSASATDHTGTAGYTAVYSFPKLHTVTLGSDLKWGWMKNITLKDEQHPAEHGHYLNYTLSLDRFDINAGLRTEYSSAYGPAFSPGASLIWTVRGERPSRLSLRITRAFNAPPLNFRFAEDTGIPFTLKPNPDLAAEYSWNLGLGYAHTFNRFVDAYADLYHHWVRDLVTTELNPADNRFVAENVGRAVRRGMETGVGIRPFPNPDWKITGAFSYNQMRDTDRDEPVLTTDASVLSVIGAAAYRKSDGSRRFDLRARYKRWNAPGNTEERGLILDAEFRQQVYAVNNRRFHAFVMLKNILDEEQYPIDVYPNPERYLEGGILVEF